MRTQVTFTVLHETLNGALFCPPGKENAKVKAGYLSARARRPLGIIRVRETTVYLGHIFYEQELSFHCPLKTYLSAMENENEFLLMYNAGGRFAWASNFHNLTNFRHFPSQFSIF